MRGYGILRPWAEQLQTENERLVEELAQLRDRAILAEEEKTHRDREAQQLREEMQKWASAAEYFQGLSMKCLLQLEEAASSIEAKKHELRAPGMQRPCWSQLVHVKARIRRCADFDSSYEESASLLAKLWPWHSHKK